MYKMRKILTIRTPFVIHNKTLFDYVINFYVRSTGAIEETVVLKSDKKCPIPFKYY